MALAVAVVVPMVVDTRGGVIAIALTLTVIVTAIVGVIVTVIDTVIVTVDITVIVTVIVTKSQQSAPTERTSTSEYTELTHSLPTVSCLL